MFKFEETDQAHVRMSQMKNHSYVKPDKPKADKPKLPFKKGTRKYSLYKKLNKAPIERNSIGFHEKELRNIAITDVNKVKAVDFYTKISNEDIDKLTKRTKVISVLINCSDGIFRRISLKSYLKLCKLHKIIIVRECVIQDPCQFVCTVTDSDKRIITTINHLLRYLTEERIRCDCIYETQVRSRGYDMYDFKYRIMTVDTKGNYKYYNDINKFCKKFMLDLI